MNKIKPIIERPFIDRETKEQIRMLKARGIPLSQIAKSVGLSEDDIDHVLKSLLTDIESSCLTEMMSSIDGYSTMILDLTSLISELKESKKPEDRKELSDYLKQRSELQAKKVDLITKAFDMQKKSTINPGQQTAISSYEEKPTRNETNRNQEFKRYIPDTDFLKKRSDLDFSLKEKRKICQTFCYNILAILSGLKLTRKIIKHNGVDKRTRKIITRAVGCTNQEFKTVIDRVIKNKFPKPKNKKEIKLKLTWKKKFNNKQSK